MNLQENIERIHEIMGEGKDAYVERAPYDQEYEEEYPKWKKILINFLETKIDSYSENDNVIVLFNNGDKSKYLIRYNKDNEQIWYDYSLKDNLEGYIPYGYLSRHFKYAVQDFFKEHFPEYGVREINAASIG
jgi:hypothetical protein